MSVKQIHRIFEAGSVDGLLKLQQKENSIPEGYQVVFKRYFLSDTAQARELPDEQGAVSVICQPPLSGASAGVWLWMADCGSVHREDGLTVACEGDDRHVWTSGLVSDAAGPELQMSGIFSRYEGILEAQDMTMADNCVRTWIFVDDIDHNYPGVVKGRRERFETAGLTPETHYIASTGIEGRSPRQGCTVQMDAYAVFSPALRQRYLYAPTHMNPTYEYGVTFERGVRMECPDTSATFISGTASIDNRGSVVHVGDVLSQTFRMWENVEALLSEAGNGWEDVRQILVYLRNASDFGIVAPLFARKFPDTPYIILKAPVCRPDWLIEMECLA